MENLNDTFIYLNLLDQKEIDKWCSFFKCDENTLRYCVRNVGKSIVSIESFLSMNKDWITSSNRI